VSRLTFIIGGARSGKSDYAEKMARGSNGRVLYIATAQPLDDEMRRRIESHRQNRSPQWRTLELPVNVGAQLLTEKPHAEVVLLDCITLLISNLLRESAKDLDQPEESAAREAVETEIRNLVNAIETMPAHWLVVSNEVGQGVVPAYPAGRLFRDLLGWANKQLAERADDVLWMMAGIPVPIGQHRATKTNL
jgi:adenosylcobinamide kinase/adenosylcobinamide-phosphate guanylyltransferase